MTFSLIKEQSARVLDEVHVSAATTVTATQRVIYVDTTDGAVAVTLPPAGSVPDTIFTCEVEAGTGAMTVKEGSSTISSGTFDAAGDRAVYYSNGRRYFQLISVIA